MSRHYGTQFQHGYVVADAQEAMRDWTTRLGIGPFFIYPSPIPFLSVKVWGQAVEAQIHRHVYMGYTGTVQIELIEPTGADSPYTDFLRDHGPGLQHFGFLADDFDAQRAAAIERGMVPALEGRQQHSRMCYLWDPNRPTDPMIELVDMKPERRAMFDRMRAPSVGWDGSDPLREL